MKPAAQLITAACVVQVLGFLSGLPADLANPAVSPHEFFHLVLAWFWLTGLNLMLIALAWGPLRRREAWSMAMLLFGGIAAQGGQFLASSLVPAGRHPEWWYDIALALVALAYAGGLVLAWRDSRPHESLGPARSHPIGEGHP